MNAINEKTIQESSLIESSGDCDIMCGTECLALPSLKFAARETCLSLACSCQINLYYRPNMCNMECAQRCNLLKSFGEFGRERCMAQCGCPQQEDESMPSVPLNLVQSSSDETLVQKAQLKMGVLRKFLMVGMFIIVMWTSVFAIIRYPIKAKMLFVGESVHDKEEELTNDYEESLNRRQSQI